MTKKELLSALAGFDDDIEIYRKEKDDSGAHDSLSTVTYETNYGGNEAVVLN